MKSKVWTLEINKLNRTLKMRKFIYIFIFISITTALNAQNRFYKKELNNGFRYIIKENDLPTNRIEFRLILGIGSLQEEKGEEGAAHFIEHLAFRNTHNFPNGGLVKRLESLGGRYGININAYTGYERTVYFFSVPSNETGAIELGIDIAKEWLNNINIGDSEVDTEKPIIIEEIANGSDFNCFDKLKKGDNANLHRHPIASPKEVNKLNTNILRKFYKRYYRPENASLVIVGANINIAKTKIKIDNAFGKIEGNPKKRVQQKKLSYKNTQNFEICEDKDISKVYVECIYPQKTKTGLTIEDLAENEKQQFILAMLNRRLQKKSLNTRLSLRWYLNGTDHLLLETSAEKHLELLSEVKNSLSVLYGIEQCPLDANEIKCQYEDFKNYNNDFRWSSEAWCNHFMDILLTDTKRIENVKELNKLDSIISNINLEEWNDKAAKIINSLKKPLIGYKFNPEKHSKLSYEHFIRAIKEGRNSPDTSKIYINPTKKEQPAQDISSLIKEFDYNPLMIESARIYKNIGVRDLYLKNGVRLIMKKTSDMDSIISVNMTFKGGLSSIPKSKYPLLEDLASYMGLGGIEGINGDNFQDVMYENKLSFIYTMDNYRHGIMASGKLDKSIMLTNLIYQKCFNPEICHKDFEDLKKDLLESEYIKKERPTHIKLRMAVGKILDGNLQNKRKFKKGELKLLNIDSIAAFYKRIYTNSQGLTCILVGNFDETKTEKQFVAMLSKFNKIKKSNILYSKEEDQYPHIKNIGGSTDEGRVYFNYIHKANCDKGLRQKTILKIMAEIIRTKIIKELRNKSGLIYSPYIDFHYNYEPKPYFAFDINGSTNSYNAQIVKTKIDNIIRECSQEYIPQNELRAIKKSYMLTKEAYLTDESITNWKKYIMTCVKDDISFYELERYDEMLESISPSDILKEFKQLMNKLKSYFLYIGEINK